MICPLRAGSAGGTHDCMIDDCAWWDSTLNQCCIKTMSIPVDETPHRNDWRADGMKARCNGFTDGGWEA